MRRIQVCTVGDINEGGMLGVDIGSDRIAVYRVGDAYFATPDICTHGQSSLSEEGELDGFVIECGWHMGRFDIRTGGVLARPCTEPLRTYPITVDGNGIFIEISGDA